MPRLVEIVVLGGLLGACGPVPGTPDATPGAPDATAGGAVTVVVYTPSSDATPAVGATVVVQDAAGATISVQRTDAAGEVTETIEAGARVTVVRIREGGADLTTILDVEPGDRLEFGAALDVGAVRGSMTFDYVPFAGMPAPTAYGFFTACTSYTPVLVGPNLPHPPITDRCPATFGMLAVAYAGAEAVRYVFDPAVPFAAGTARALPSAWVATPSLAVAYTQVPFAVVQSLTTSAGPVLDGRARFSAARVSAPDAINLGVSLVVPQIGDGLQTSTLLRREATFGVQQVATRGPVTSSYGVDLGATMLPWIAAPTLDVAGQTVAWAVDGPGVPAVVAVDVTFGAADPDAELMSSTWRLIAPGERTALSLPVLPAEVGDLAPTATDEISVAVRALALDAGGGYAAVRGVVDRHLDGGVEPWLRRAGTTRVTISAAPQAP